jgi:hypothetical protein
MHSTHQVLCRVASPTTMSLQVPAPSGNLSHITPHHTTDTSHCMQALAQHSAANSI